MSKKVAIVQSSYIPWKGYFDLINAVDEFILLDDVQYTRRDWRNRNRIKTPQGITWLTIPVAVKGKYLQRINETVISDPEWNKHHWKTLVHNYSRAKYFSEYRASFEELYLNCGEELLSRVNFRFLAAICELLGIRTCLTWSSAYRLVEGKTERIVELCRQAGAAEYISGPRAEAYIEEKLFCCAGVRLRYMDYSGYPEYCQLYPPFEHRVSILDLIFNEGPKATQFMKTF